MNFIISSLLFLQTPIFLSKYREKLPVQDVVENEFKPRKVCVIDKHLEDNEELHDINKETMDFYLEKWGKMINKVDSYRLQFYNGKDRSKATNLLKNLSNHFPSIMFDLKYEHSNFIVLSQKYFSFIEALVVYKSIGYINVIIIHNEELC